MRIGINCGHTLTGAGSGAVGFLNESKETRNVGLALIDMLREQGHEVVNCTDDYSNSTSQNLREICDMANRQALDLFVSLHFNAGRGKGTEVYTYGGTDKAKAGQMLNALCKLGFVNRGIKNGSHLYVVKNTSAPACLVEVCFVDTENDSNLYNKIGSNKVAAALCEAITGVPPRDNADESEKVDIVENFSKTRFVVTSDFAEVKTSANNDASAICNLIKGTIVNASKKCTDWLYISGKDQNRNDIEGWMPKACLMRTSIQGVNSNMSIMAKNGIDYMVDCGLINDPEHWYVHIFDIDYLINLIISISNKLSSKAIISDPFKDPINDLKLALDIFVKEGIINNPTYWVENATSVEYLDVLISRAATWLQ